MLHEALRLAEIGYRVFPCASNLKRPATQRGLHDATTDAEQIESWWTANPLANVAICTDGLLVVDVDTIDGRENPWLTPERALELAAAPCSLTPRGGRHYFFKQPSNVSGSSGTEPVRRYRNTASRIAPHVDTRADGGYVLVWPSVVDGKEYAWSGGEILSVSPESLPEPPAWLLAMLDSGSVSNERHDLPPAGNSIPEGQRNAALTRLAGVMRQHGMGEQELLAAIRATNATRCKPPLDDAELQTIARSVSRYEPDRARVAIAEGHAAHGNDQLGPVLTSFADIEPRSIEWLWPGRVAAGRLNLLVGMPGAGKSFLTCDMASRVSTGTAWPDGAACPLGSVIVVSAEDDPHDTIRPRLDAHAADVRRIHLLSGVRALDPDGKPEERVFTLADLPALEAALQQAPDCKLIVVDPIGSYLGGRTDAHRDNEVRSVLAPIAKLAQEYGPAVLIVAHRRKGHATLADDTALGSRAFVGIARSVWHLSKDPQNPQRRLLLPGKNNLAPEPDGLAFELSRELGAIVWEPEPVALSADEALQRENDGQPALARDAAGDWLQAFLANGRRPTTEVQEAAASEGIAPATLKRAKKRLNVESTREEFGGPWLWHLPEGGQELPKALKGENVIPYGECDPLWSEGTA